MLTAIAPDWSISVHIRRYGSLLPHSLISSNTFSPPTGVGSTAAFVLGNILGESLSCELVSERWTLTFGRLLARRTSNFSDRGCVFYWNCSRVGRTSLPSFSNSAVCLVDLSQICSSTSGGHFNPAVTISFVLFKKFPPLKALRYAGRHNIVRMTLTLYYLIGTLLLKSLVDTSPVCLSMSSTNT